MKLFWFGILGLLVQGTGLAAFMLVSRSSDAMVGKITVVVIVGLAVCTLLWEGVRRSKGILTVCALPFLLTLSYVLAIHLLGMLGFPGLLRDAWPPWLDYFLSVLRMSGDLLVMYGLATALLFAMSRALRKIRLYASHRSPKLS
jgi:hypothetical protein